MKFQQVAVAALFAGAYAAPSQGKGKDDYSVGKHYQTNGDGDVMYCKGGWEVAQKSNNGGSSSEKGASDKGSSGNGAQGGYQLKKRVKWLRHELDRAWEERHQAKQYWEEKKKV